MVLVWSMEEIIILNGFIIGIQLYNGVMDIIVMRTQKFHTQLKACLFKLLTESMYKMSTLWLKI